MPMPTEWTASMMWMRMPGQTWPGAAASFVAMWTAMMVPMMLPTVAPVLWRHREAAELSGSRYPGALTATAATAYLSVWAVVGVAAFVAGASFAVTVPHHPAIAPVLPVVPGALIAMAGAIQLTSWKTRRLACCRQESSCEASRSAGASRAWQDGLELGLRCAACCANLMMIPFVLGTMNVWAMVAVAAAIAAERRSALGERVARIIGVILVAAGSCLAARALVL